MGMYSGIDWGQTPYAGQWAQAQAGVPITAPVDTSFDWNKYTALPDVVVEQTIPPPVVVPPTPAPVVAVTPPAPLPLATGDGIGGVEMTYNGVQTSTGITGTPTQGWGNLFSGIGNIASNPLMLIMLFSMMGKGGSGGIMSNPLMLMMLMPSLFSSGSGSGMNAVFTGMNSPLNVQNMMLWGMLPSMGKLAPMLLGGVSGMLGNEMFRKKKTYRRRTYVRNNYYRGRRRRY